MKKIINQNQKIKKDTIKDKKSLYSKPENKSAAPIDAY